MTGYLFGDRYQVGDTLGFGGMSEVHRGRDLRLGRDVAVKVLRADLARDPSFQARFRREAQNAASLNHPAIVAVYDTGDTAGETGPVPYIVMEYVDGDTLRDVLKREGPLPPRRAMEIVADVCAALDFSHRHGIVHRDVKPANIMLNRAGAVKVMDFGIARAVSDGQATMTATSAVIGTAQYLSPEQARGESVDARSDVYATGCVLYELLTGQPPFTGDSPVAIAYQHVREAPRPPSEAQPGLPKELDAIVLKALNKNPLNRYQTAAEMRSDLVRALSGQAVQATPLMSDDERTELMRAAPTRVGAGGSPPLLAPPVRSVPEGDWEPEDADRSKRVWGFVGIGVLCLALLAGAIWLTLRVISAPPPQALVSVPDLSGMTQEEATAKLRDSRLTLGTINPTESSDADKDKVVNQRPSSQTQVAQDSPVNLEIGKGVSLVSVPNVVSYTPDAAKKALNDANLQYQEVPQSSSDADKGKALAQDPAAQAQVVPGSTVKVTIGTGLETVQVPDGIVGQSLDQATAALGAAKLQVVSQEADGTEPANQVTGMDPAPGTRVQEGTPITLTVSNNSLMVMPNLQNSTPDQAVGILQNNGWAGDADSLSKSTKGTNNPGLVGAILSQSPAQGTVVPKAGTAVKVVVGEAGAETIPDVVGKTEAEARAAMAGIPNVTWGVAGATPPGQAGTVQGQTAAGAVPIGTPVTVNVYGPEA
ncbi:MAG TPA: Stk1 family PASTA domain-containing Ser/Thr kinase, partial [Nakamurella sp.]|nr:Stk1 family PASTA domain-containing Ser/Thr kinase [Nakamurella sp.]